MMPPLVEQRYEFKGGYPVRETIKDAYDELDLLRALQMYRAFYPTVSGAAIFRGSANVGVAPNKVFGSIRGRDTLGTRSTPIRPMASCCSICTSVRW